MSYHFPSALKGPSGPQGPPGDVGDPGHMVKHNSYIYSVRMVKLPCEYMIQLFCVLLCEYFTYCIRVGLA